MADGDDEGVAFVVSVGAEGIAFDPVGADAEGITYAVVGDDTETGHLTIPRGEVLHGYIRERARVGHGLVAAAAADR